MALVNSWGASTGGKCTLSSNMCWADAMPAQKGEMVFFGARALSAPVIGGSLDTAQKWPQVGVTQNGKAGRVPPRGSSLERLCASCLSEDLAMRENVRRTCALSLLPAAHACLQIALWLRGPPCLLEARWHMRRCAAPLRSCALVSSYAYFELPGHQVRHR
jgi:hypothetical protein